MSLAFACPVCACKSSKVTHSEMVTEQERHRTRKCQECGSNYRTFEQVMDRVTHMKRNHKSHFVLLADYQKLSSAGRKGLQIALKALIAMEQDNG